MNEMDELTRMRASVPAPPPSGRAQTAPQEVRVVRPDGSVVRRYASATDAWWSPDGRSLGLDHDDRPYYDVPPSQPYVDHHSLRIARVPGAPGQPRAARAGPWSPDGRWMAATDGYTDVWVIPVRGGPARRVASLEPEGDIDEIWWSLDGKRLFFSWVFTSLD